MDQLSALAKRWSRRGVCWLGDISDVRMPARPIEIARRAGFNPPDDLTLPQIKDVVASRIISYGLHESLVYGRQRYREGVAREVLTALRELGPSAEFWADNPHSDFADEGSTYSYGRLTPMTTATFEVGVIAANTSVGFIWWRTEED